MRFDLPCQGWEGLPAVIPLGVVSRSQEFGGSDLALQSPAGAWYSEGLIFHQMHVS